MNLLDECVDEEGVHLAVNVLDGDLEAVETPGLRNLHQSRLLKTQGPVPVDINKIHIRICTRENVQGNLF